MNLVKKILLFFSFSFVTFCNDEEDYDDNDEYEEVEVIRKKKKNTKKKPKKKKSKGRSGIIHTLTDKIHFCVDIDVVNVPYIKENILNKDLNNINNRDISSLNAINWFCPSFLIGYNFNNSKGISFKIGFANTLQTQINRYKFKAGIVFRYDLNLFLSLRLLFESGIGYCFGLKEDNRKIRVDNGGSSVFKNLSSFFNTKVDPLIFSAIFGIGLLFLSVHIGGEVSLSKLLSKHDGTSVNNDYQNIFNNYIESKGSNYIVDMLNVSVRFYPLKLVDYLIGWLI